MRFCSTISWRDGGDLLNPTPSLNTHSRGKEKSNSQPSTWGIEIAWEMTNEEARGKTIFEFQVSLSFILQSFNRNGSYLYSPMPLNLVWLKCQGSRRWKAHLGSMQVFSPLFLPKLYKDFSKPSCCKASSPSRMIPLLLIFCPNSRFLSWWLLFVFDINNSESPLRQVMKGFRPNRNLSSLLLFNCLSFSLCLCLNEPG